MQFSEDLRQKKLVFCIKKVWSISDQFKRYKTLRCIERMEQA